MGSSLGLEPEPVFRFFEEISAIPRGSGNEKAVSDYVLAFAKARGLPASQDEALNVLVQKKAYPGYEKSEPVILQSHMDMVCAKLPQTEHDFLKDPIRLVLSGDKLGADGTTLGADNGIGVAYMLALLEATNIPHPPIEALFTVSEETHMGGALALDTTPLTGKRLINLDMETEGTFTTSCAGGISAFFLLPSPKFKPPSATAFLTVTLDGLHGGHSGLEIIRQFASANRLLGRLLGLLAKKFSICLAAVSGGEKQNAIPSRSEAVIGAANADLDALCAYASSLAEVFRHEYPNEPALTLTCSPCAEPSSVYPPQTLDSLIAALVLLPDGVQSMSLSIPGLVESSCNVGILSERPDGIEIQCSFRSSVSSRKSLFAEQVQRLAAALGGTVLLESDYPAWEYREKSSLRDQLVKVYRGLYGNTPQLSAVHAGLECSVLSHKMPDVDMISIGPEIVGAHTPFETLTVSSAQRVWSFLLACLQQM